MKNGSKINQKSIKNGPKIDQTSPKIEVWRAPGQVWRPLGPSWAIQRVFGGILVRLGGVLEASWRGLGGLLGGLGPRKVANMAPTWLPKRSQNREKIEVKNDQNFDASWGRFLVDFGRFGKAKRSQVGTKIASKIDPNFERRFFEKTLFFLRKNHDFEGSGGRSWE